MGSYLDIADKALTAATAQAVGSAQAHVLAQAIDWIELVDANGRLALAHPDYVDDFVPWDQCVPADFTCPACGFIAAWWDSSGVAHCQRCERSGADVRRLEAVPRIRGRQPLTKPRTADRRSGTDVRSPTVICPCGSGTTVEIAIHGGQSTRRDCGRCGRFVDFAVWYGIHAGHKGQHRVGCGHGQETTQTD